MENKVSIEEVLVYFASKIKDTEYWDCYRSYLAAIGNYGLWHEVLYVAWEGCDENTSAKRCMDA
ncbi:hypothetical protein ABMA80_15920, partial [Halobacteriovorax sp. FRX-3]|uniref:hypothetical protein n=1 Tax=Halobacteriovorax sp. FRX-3 TaxID=3157712 RepID=UPI0037130F8C